MCESRPETKEQTVLCFGELANAFRLLHHHLSSEWTDDAVISVIDEMICKYEVLDLALPLGTTYERNRTCGSVK